MKEEKIKRVIREEIQNLLEAYGSDPGSVSAGGTDTGWFQISRLMHDINQSRPEFQDIGQKEINGETVHEFKLGNKIYQIKQL